MKQDRKYELKSFNGTLKTKQAVSENENYWKLIGQTGRVISSAEEQDFPDKNRVLFQFDIDVQKLELECHNQKPNALWILKTDLK
ncbi:hypothetical protein SAMN04488028_103316 [Reichenbachiella agariperforans]|uniref:Uncharacterized protein n=1 Tax=Reichenbachiella agariperforans TaxID=156994 RepID=A0A1M6QGW3_REIAG|nr:hypothetical protein [Reichenbachiella agariperforans]SHK19277.1 hypothetical protein SAMN04488028_103316 [Reichenbachiella agariperforans]